MNNWYFIVVSVLCIIYVISEVRKKKFSIKESFWWMVAAFAMLLLSIFPYSINWLAKIVGIAYPPSLFFVLCIIYLVFMIFRSSKKITEQQEKIIELAQQVSILREKVNNEKNNKQK